MNALWSGTNKNRDVSIRPLARPISRSLAPLTHSLAHEKVNELMSQNDLVLSHSAAVAKEWRSENCWGKEMPEIGPGFGAWAWSNAFGRARSPMIA